MLTAALVGAIANRFRGGGIITPPPHIGTQVRRVVYALAGGTMVATSFGWTEEAMWRGGMAALVLFMAHLTGWGRPIGAAGGWEDKPLKEFGLYDDLAEYLTSKLGCDKETWGVIWLTIWGIVAGFLMVFCTASLWPLLGFGCIGVVYWATFRVFMKLKGDPSRGWPTAEWVFGAISFGSLVL